LTDQPSSTAVAASGELACLDGRIAPASETFVPVVDEGFLRGDGVFEVVRVYAGRPFALPDHIDRLERSAANLRLGYPVPRAELEREARGLLAERGGARFDGCLRLVLTRGGRRLLLTEPLPAGPERPRLGFVTFAPPRVLDGIKSLSYAGNMLASRLARERGFDEALLVTPHGRVLEAPTATIFWVGAGGRLATPPLEDHILASITRDRLLRLVPVEERPLSSDELLHASEAFLASSVREVAPLGAVETHAFEGMGEATRAAASALRAHIEAELGPA
jgi:branched-chain amino acid aminotransferase